MTTNDDISIFGFVMESLERIWGPGMEAVRLRQDLDIRRAGDIPVAAEREGYEISYVDLPDKVSGFALLIDATRHIVVNRAKPSTHSQFTIAHEVGHHVLHSSSLHDADQANRKTDGNAEFEANLFAATLVTAVTTQQEQADLLRHNPEIGSTMAGYVLGTLLMIVMALVIWLCSLMFRTREAVLIETT
jgi:Zn-dependent peptidase ImmA (M78 family)